MRVAVFAITALTSAAIAAPQVTNQAAAAAVAEQLPTPADGGASCGPGAPCTGDVTHFDIAAENYGACGFPGIDGNNYLGLALPHAMMGAQSNGNPYCGKTVTITNPRTGASVVGTVIDKCGGCGGRSIDLTNALFHAVASDVDGRGGGFTWSFTEAVAQRAIEADGAASEVSVTNAGSCEGAANACVGDVTHYSGGPGSCGWNINSATQYVVSLPPALMGSPSNCRRTVTIKNPSGATVRAIVGDTCAGCTAYNLDLTEALYSNIAAEWDGRGRGFTWWFN